MKRHIAVVSVLCLGSFYAAPALAQGGLRYDPTTDRLAYGNIPGTRFKLLDEAPLTGPTLKQNAAAPGANWQANTPAHNASNGTIWADWRPWGGGWRTSAGLIWQGNLRQDEGTWANSPTQALERHSQSNTPFVGLGWASEDARTTNWRWSAEVGAYADGNGGCSSALLSCSAAAPQRKNADGDGIRVNPYFSFGANFLY